jgi:uncharacterized membrane protein
MATRLQQTWIPTVLVVFVTTPHAWCIDGFDFPVGYPNGVGWNRGFCSNANNPSCANDPCGSDALDFLEWNDYGGQTNCVRHPGEDWNKDCGGNCDCGETVHAIADGVIESRSDDCSWGATVIRHDNVPGYGTLWSVYGHMEHCNFPIGATVSRGDVIGLVAMKGATICHLHFEIRHADLGACFFPSQAMQGGDPQAWVEARYLNPTAFISSHRPTSVTPTITNLGSLPNSSSSISTDLSADGTVVVGFCGPLSTARAFRWTRNAGMQDLGALPGMGWSHAWGTSQDGSVVVGQFSGVSNTRPFRWTSANGMQDMGLPSGWAASGATDVSGDGAVIVGAWWAAPLTPASEPRGFRWTHAAGFQDLGLLPGATNALAWAVSVDGMVIVGSSGSHAFRWTHSGGMQDLGELAPGGGASARDVAEDGAFVVGSAGTSAGEVAFRWSAAGGMVGIGSMERALAVSGDGAVVVGDRSPQALIWSAGAGEMELSAYLVGLGLNPAGWSFTTTGTSEHWSVSANGRAIAGNGTFNGMQRAWLLTGLPAQSCYANCDGSPTPPILNVGDFTCFLQRFAAGNMYANCDNSTAPPILNVGDFTCFLQRFAAGCP